VVRVRVGGVCGHVVLVRYRRGDDDMQQQQQQHSDQDSDEDLSGINFPIIDSSRRDQSTTKISCKDDIKKSNYDTSNNQITNNKKGVVDEDAIIRCFNISVNSHMNKSDTVEVFEPMPPKNEVVSKTTLSKADQPTKKKKVEQ